MQSSMESLTDTTTDTVRLDTYKVEKAFIIILLAKKNKPCVTNNKLLPM